MCYWVVVLSAERCEGTYLLYVYWVSEGVGLVCMKSSHPRSVAGRLLTVKSSIGFTNGALRGTLLRNFCTRGPKVGVVSS